MNAFQILDKYNQPIAISRLDREVCALVGNEVDERHYCILGKREDHESEFKYLYSLIILDSNISTVYAIWV